MSHTLTHTAKKVERKLPPIPTPYTALTLWRLLNSRQQMVIKSRMRGYVLDRNNSESVREYMQSVAEMAYELLRVRERSEGGLDFA